MADFKKIFFYVATLKFMDIQRVPQDTAISLNIG